MREGMPPVVPVFRCSLAWLGHLFLAALAVHRRKLCQGVRSYTSDSHRDGSRALFRDHLVSFSVKMGRELLLHISCGRRLCETVTDVRRPCLQTVLRPEWNRCRSIFSCHHIRRGAGESGEKKYLPFTAISHECVPDVVLSPNI